MIPNDLFEEYSSRRGLGIGGHQRAYEGQTNEWLTPKWVIDKLGPFDLDPCASTVRPWDTARKYYTAKEDGLLQDWEGCVWLNPPYGSHTGKWLDRLAKHGNGISLIFARTDTDMFHRHIFEKADGILFIEGRLTFCYTSGKPGSSNSGGPSVLVSYGNECTNRMIQSGIKGRFLRLK